MKKTLFENFITQKYPKLTHDEIKNSIIQYDQLKEAFNCGLIAGQSINIHESEIFIKLKEIYLKKYFSEIREEYRNPIFNYWKTIDESQKVEYHISCNLEWCGGLGRDGRFKEFSNNSLEELFNKTKKFINDLEDQCR